MTDERSAKIRANKQAFLRLFHAVISPGSLVEASTFDFALFMWAADLCVQLNMSEFVGQKKTAALQN